MKKSKTLHLKLREKWYDMILSGKKTVEYREIKDRYISLLFDWKDWPNIVGLSGKEVRGFFTDCFMANSEATLIKFFKGYDTITFQNGYSKTDPSFEIEFELLEVGEGRTDWGAKEGVKYFCLKLGKIITT